MTGVQFVVDENGKETAVQLDLSIWGELWEDIHDVIVARERMNEPTIPWEEFKKRIDSETVADESISDLHIASR